MARDKMSTEEIKHRKRLNDERLEKVLRMSEERFNQLRKTFQEKISNIEISGGKRNKKIEFLLIIKEDINEFINNSVPFKQISVFIKNIFGIDITPFDLRSFAVTHLDYKPKLMGKAVSKNNSAKK